MVSALNAADHHALDQFTLDEGVDHQDGQDGHDGDGHTGGFGGQSLGCQHGRLVGQVRGLQELDGVHQLLQVDLDGIELGIGDVVKTAGPVVPVAQSGEQTDGGHDGLGQRNHNAGVDPHIIGAVDPGGFDDGVGDIGIEVVADHQDIHAAHQGAGENVGPDGVLHMEESRPDDVAGGHTAVEQNGEELIFRVSGDGFLYNMVRIMIGTLLWINEGKIEKGSIPSILEAKDRLKAGKTAPACGLYLNKVFY